MSYEEYYAAIEALEASYQTAIRAAVTNATDTAAANAAIAAIVMQASAAMRAALEAYEGVSPLQ